MRVFFIFCCLLSSCSNPRKTLFPSEYAPHVVGKPKELPNIRIMVDNDSIIHKKIVVSLNNRADRALFFSSPKCYESIIIMLSRNGERLDGNKFNFGGNCINEYIGIDPGANMVMAYRYPIAELFPYLPEGKYSMHVEYNGYIKDESGVYIDFNEPIKSQTVEFKISE